MKMRLSLPNSLPVVGAIVGALIPLSYNLGIMFSQLFFARPRSTWILGLFWLPMVAFKPALIGLIIGSVLWLLVVPFMRSRPLTSNEIKGLKIALIILIFSSASTGTAKIFGEVARCAPHIVYTSGAIKKVGHAPHQYKSVQDAVLTWEWSSDESPSVQITWNGDVVTAYGVDSSIIVANQTQILKRMKLGNEDFWCNSVRAIPVRFDKSKPEKLALLVKANSIITCYILIVFDSEGQLAYHEILKPTKRPDNPLQKVISDSDGREFLIVDLGSPIVYVNN